MKLHHIAIAVQEINPAVLALFGISNVRPHDVPVYDECQEATVGLYGVDGTQIEFVTGKAVKKVLKSKSAAMYHVCFEVGNLDKAIERATENGWVVWKEPAPAILFGGRRVVFLMHKDFGLIEYLEGKRNG